MSRTPREPRQFRALFREFLFRMVDVELLSSGARGDTSKLLGQFAALLLFLSILFSLPALGVGSVGPPQSRLMAVWSGEHFLIATTMLVAGLFAVLRWEATYPDRRDVFVLGALPVRARTIFAAKIAGVGASLGLAVLVLHAVAGVVWPIAIHRSTSAHPMPALTMLPAAAPYSAARIGPEVDRDLPLLPGEGIVVGVSKGGERRVYAYGTARIDSIFQIGSISKTFTALTLAQMTSAGQVRLDDPVRELLPPGTASRPMGPEIRLLDLATHRSGLSGLPGNLNRAGKPNIGADYHTAELLGFLSKRGVARPANPPFRYSNLGFGLLGEALASRAGIPFAELVEARIAKPLGLPDTGIALTEAQRSRVIPAFDWRGQPMRPWELDALAGAGALHSTAGDMLTYLENYLRPPGTRLGEAMIATLLPRAEVGPGLEIGLGWIHDTRTGVYWHNGAISGYTSHVFFHPADGYAAVVLVNQGIGGTPVSEILARHIRQRFTGSPAVSLANVDIPESWFLRVLGAYWLAMLGAGIFVFFGVLAVQGLAAYALPRRWLLRISSWMQLGTFGLLLCVYFIQPMAVTPDAIMAAQGQELMAWSPSYWFLGLLQQLSGSPALGVLAERAWAGLAAVVGAVMLAYALSYSRTLRDIAEEPEITPGALLEGWAPGGGTSLDRSIGQFSARTLLRSRQHRMLLAFYLGIAFALTIFYLRAPNAARDLVDGPVQEAFGFARGPLLAASFAVMGFWVIGVRVVFSLPLEVRARWLFQMTPVEGTRRLLRARRIALLTLSVFPAVVCSAAVFFWLWPWPLAAAHLLVLGLTGLVLAEACLVGAQKIPFTCSYLPGRSHFHLTFWLCLGLAVQVVGQVAEWELLALERPVWLAALAGGMILAWAALRRWPVRALLYEEYDRGEVQELDLGGIGG